MSAATARAELLDEFGNVVGGAFPRGETTVPRHPQPDGRARGSHDPAAAYFAMDVVAFSMARSGAPSGTAPARCQATVGCSARKARAASLGRRVCTSGRSTSPATP